MLLGEITCWSFLRVERLNDHSVFSFFSVFQKLSHEAHVGSIAGFQCHAIQNRSK